LQQNRDTVLFKEIIYLIQKDFVLEWRQKYAFNGMLLYVGSTVFICFLSFGIRSDVLSEPIWNALLWIILLFTSVNAIAKSFMQESRGRLLYFYSIASPQGIIMAKIIYNTFLMLILAVVCFVFYAFVLGNPVQDIPMFLLSLLLGAIGFSTSLTMISGIAAKASNGSTLMAILSFPVIVPMLLMLIKMSKNAMDGLDRGASLDELLTLLAINMIVITVSYILFPYLWRT
jgi:heme exporter protein B